MSQHKAGKILTEKSMLLKLGTLQYRYIEMLQAGIASQADLLRQLQLIAHCYADIAERRAAARKVNAKILSPKVIER